MSLFNLSQSHVSQIHGLNDTDIVTL